MQPLKFTTGVADIGRLGALDTGRLEVIGVERLFSLSEAMHALWGFLGAILELFFGASFVGLFRISERTFC